MRLVGCQYCKKARAFWAYDSHGSPHGSYQNAHIEVGTNIFHDTAGRQMRIRYCPMCGRSLLDTSDAGGGNTSVVSIFAAPKSPRRILTYFKECMKWLTSETTAVTSGLIRL